MSANEGGIIVTKEDVEKFRRECVWLRSLWLHFQTLFEGRDLKRELRATAPAFFADVYRLFEEHLISHICRLTDEVEIKRGRKNLTVKFLIEHSDFSTAPDTLEELRRLSESIHRFRERILPARKWFIAHLDLEAVRLGKPLGAASDSEWKQFWRDLQDFLDLMHWHHGDRNAHPGAGWSDAESLLTALRDAVTPLGGEAMSEQKRIRDSSDLPDNVGTGSPGQGGEVGSVRLVTALLGPVVPLLE